MTRIIIFLAILLSSIMLQAQEVISAGGETINNSAYEISYTIGEPVIETITDGDNVLTQGMHQSKLTVTSISELLNPEMQVEVFPNPTQDFVIIRFDRLFDNLNYSIFDITGKRIDNSIISLSETTLDFTNYIQGTYILKLQHENKEAIQTFKIIKH